MTEACKKSDDTSREPAICRHMRLVTYIVPNELQDLLLEFFTASMIEQPSDIVEYAYCYFRRLRDYRHYNELVAGILPSAQKRPPARQEIVYKIPCGSHQLHQAGEDVPSGHYDGKSVSCKYHTVQGSYVISVSGLQAAHSRFTVLITQEIS